MLAPRTPDNQRTDDPNRVVLETLERSQQLIRALENDILALVTEAHFRGSSWSEIARRLGRSKQCVHARYQSRMHANATHEALRQDLARAWRQARAMQLQGGANDEVDMLVAFLRERTPRTPKPGGDHDAGRGRGGVRPAGRHR